MENCLSRLPKKYLPWVRSALDKALALPGVAKVMIFGSYAKGTENADSDLDIAVFFVPGAADLRSMYRQLTRIFTNPDIDIQVQALSSLELNDPCGIVDEIVRYGIEYRTVQPCTDDDNEGHQPWKDSSPTISTPA